MPTHRFKTIRGWFWFHISRIACSLSNYAEDQRCLYEGAYREHWKSWTAPTETNYWATYTVSET